MNSIFEIEVYETDRGACPFLSWLNRLATSTRVRIMTQLDRLALGNFGACKSLGNGLHEVRVHFGPGYRVYFGKYGGQVVLLLCGGDKASQRKDIMKASQYWQDVKGYLRKQGGRRGTYKKL